MDVVVLARRRRFGRLRATFEGVEEVVEVELPLDEADERAHREIASSTTLAIVLATSRVDADEVEEDDE